MSETLTTESPEAIDSINEVLTDTNTDNVSLETLVLLINIQRLKQLREKSMKEFGELKTRQEQVRALHTLLKKINKATSDKGELNIASNPELKELLAKAKELGIEMKEGQTAFSKDERDRLVENIRMTVEDLNVLNDMQLQTVNRYTNERYESYQLARAIIKPLHEAKMQISRGIK